MTNRWNATDAPRGDDYDARWKALAASGQSVHGEVDCVEWLCALHDLGHRVIDAGCGTGRVAIELAQRGYEVVGVDADEAMLVTARQKAAGLQWIAADLATWAPDDDDTIVGYDAAVLAGNVMIFVAPGTETAVLRALSARLRGDGLLIAGFQVRADRLPLGEYDASARRAGFELVDRYSTWDRAPYSGGDYAVSVHRRVG